MVAGLYENLLERSHARADRAAEELYELIQQMKNDKNVPLGLALWAENIRERLLDR